MNFSPNSSIHFYIYLWVLNDFTNNQSYINYIFVIATEILKLISYI